MPHHKKACQGACHHAAHDIMPHSATFDRASNPNPMNSSRVGHASNVHGWQLKCYATWIKGLIQASEIETI